MPRSALIVDDSRTALAALSRLLKAQGVAVDMVESGPEALDYLRSNSPGVIFLDHMMPGMDGFETLAALKSNARTSAIPVVMYTSREGDAYMGQALVQGAFGILQKPVDPAGLQLILKRIDQLRAPPTVLSESAPGPAGRSPTGPAPARPRAAVTGVIHVPPEFRKRSGTSPEPAVPTATDDRVLQSGTETPSRFRLGRFPLRRVLFAAILLLPGAWYFAHYRQAQQLLEQVRQENQGLRAEQVKARETSEVSENSPQRADLQAEQRSDRETRALLDTVSWALNRHGQYGYGDEPLGDARLAQMRELIARLAAAGFQGTVRLETHIGEFCLMRDEQGNLRVPGDGLAIGRCEVVTYPPAQAAQFGLRQSPAFARFLSERRPGNPIQIAVVSHGASHPLVTYPDVAGIQTAGDWNQVARLNQRVEIVLLPAQ